MIFNQVDLFLNSINSYASLFRGNCFIANISKNEIEQAFTQNSKYQDYDFDFLFDHARNFINELNENSEKHSFNEIERFYNSKLNSFYSDLINVFAYTKSIESNFNQDTGLFSSEFEDNMNTIAFGFKNVAQIILNGLKQYFTPPLPNEIMMSFYPFDEIEPETPRQAKYTIRQIALKLAYEDVTVTNENADEIIKKFGHTSGLKLYLEFNKVWSSKKRISDPDISLKILQNKIKLFESVAEILSTEHKPKAEDEIKILNSYLSKY